VKEPKDATFDSLVDSIGDTLGLIPIHLQRSSFVKDAIPTGSLCLDLILGGGWAPGRVIIPYGKSGSGKSTLTFFSIAWATKMHIPVFHFDYEGAADSEYMRRIGVKIDWTKEKQERSPIYYRYYFPDNGEQFFRFIRRTAKKLEDRTSGPVQAIFFADSAPAMLPEDRAEDDEKNPMAMTARMFSENFPLIKSIMAQKRITVVITNQLRLKPGVSFGSPLYETGGEALKLYSDQRLCVDSRSVPEYMRFSGKGPIAEEPCWDGNGVDRYMYINSKTVKNKVFSPFRETWFRIWFEECGHPGRGIDPVFDLYQFLIETNQVERKKGKLKILLPGCDAVEPLDWQNLKAQILDPKKRAELNLYKICRKQLETGDAFKLYFNHAGKRSDSSDNEDASSSEKE